MRPWSLPSTLFSSSLLGKLPLVKTQYRYNICDVQIFACDIAISDFALSRDFRYRISDFPFFISSSSSMMRYRSSKIENLSSKIFKIEDRCSILIAISTFQVRSLSPEKFKISKIFKVFLYYLETSDQGRFRNFKSQIQKSNPKSGYRKMLNSRMIRIKISKILKFLKF